MADPTSPRSTRRAVDAAALQRIRRRLAAAVDPPWLHVETAKRMAERLPIFRVPPRRVIDWYGHDGASAAALAAACPGAQRLRIDPFDPPLPAARLAPWWSPQRWRRAPVLQPAASLPQAAGDLLWAHMGLHWCADPVAEMRRWHAALAIDGVLMFTTFGPGTLASLHQLGAARGWPPAAAPLVDMHDLGDMLVEAGFAEPVMDQETLTLHWADAESLLAELRTLGGNADPARAPGLCTPRWKRELLTALTPSDGSRPALDFEIVYGHAIRPRPRVPVAAETRVGLEAMRSILRG
jgi:malonyl-CoA O-methyltransferase